LRRCVEGDREAFAELVRRYGNLVWSACRHLTGGDAGADDAFQATFVILFRNTGKIRDVGRLSSWLHGVAHRVCAKARLTAKRRKAREQAVDERNGAAVPNSAWDRALAAVHEELGSLAETLRVPLRIVLSGREGRDGSGGSARLETRHAVGTVQRQLLFPSVLPQQKMLPNLGPHFDAVLCAASTRPHRGYPDGAISGGW
jgi:RNA polymerase sigma factor (sigma-70 family)